MGGDPRKHRWGEDLRQEGKETLSSQIKYWVTRAQSHWGSLGDSVDHDWGLSQQNQQKKKKSKQNITRDIEVKTNLTIARGEAGGDCGEKGFQELL